MTAPLVEVDRIDRVCRIRLNRESKRNALSEAMRDEIEARFREAEQEASIGAVVLTGGTQVFSAGFDLEEVSASRFETFRHRAREFTGALYGFSKPLVVAVAGAALAGGFDLALAGDFIVAAETARFGHPELDFGAPPAIAALWTRVGLVRAKQLALLGEAIGATEALRIGLVDRVVPVERLLPEALELARTLAGKPPAAQRAVKRVCRWIATFELLEGIAREAAEGQEALADPENLARLEAALSALRRRS